MPKLMFRRQCTSRIRHQLVLSLHRAMSPRIPENSPANSPSAERWRTADRKRPLPIPLRRFFPAEWHLSPSLAHKSAFLLYHFLVLIVGLDRIMVISLVLQTHHSSARTEVYRSVMIILA
jgi:hypothetical protein